MKLIQCIIRREKLDDVVCRLVAYSACLTASEVGGSGRQKARAVYRGVEYVILQPRAMIEIAIDDDMVGDIVKILIETARTGECGDGRIFVLPVEGAYHIRTGFMDPH
jgi:nitrogen regulatory protein P-II 1